MQDFHDAIHLFHGGHQGWRQADHLAPHAGKKPALHHLLVHARTHFGVSRERRLAGLVRHQLNGGHQAEAAHVADAVQVVQRMQPFQQAIAHLGGPLHQPLAFDDVDVGQRHRATGGMGWPE